MQHHVIIISHRRSGTHLTIDTVRNNFKEYDSDYINLDKLFFKEDNMTFESLQHELNKAPRIIKTHLLPSHYYYINKGNDQQKFLSDLFNDSLKIYVERDGRDVMVSLFHYLQKFDSNTRKSTFQDFLRSESNYNTTEKSLTNLEFWKFHVDSWKKLENNLLLIKFEDLISNFKGELKRISDFINLEPAKIINPRLGRSNTYFEKFFVKLKIKLKLSNKHTAVGFRKGRIGDYTKYFHPGDFEYYEKVLLKEKP